MSSSAAPEDASGRRPSPGVLAAACEVLAQVPTATAVSPSVLLECLYYAAEEDLLRLMRLAAVLNPPRRAQAEEQLRALLSPEELSRS
jgi:hypothetical protein